MDLLVLPRGVCLSTKHNSCRVCALPHALGCLSSSSLHVPRPPLPRAAEPLRAGAERGGGRRRTWAATLLQSSNVAYKYGVSGPFWYAAGATIQIILFGILAIEVKRKAPTAHTVLEIISAPSRHPALLTTHVASRKGATSC